MSIYLAFTTLTIHTREPQADETLPTYVIERGGDVDRLYYRDERDGEQWPIDSWATDGYSMINVEALINDWINDSDARSVYVNVGADGIMGHHRYCNFEINFSGGVCCHTHKVTFQE